MRYRNGMAAPDRAYAFAKARILDGRFPGGTLITEGSVAAATDLSRTPVREAFARLAAEGLLRIYPKRGARVVPVSAVEVESVMETRLLVEQFAIEKVIEHEIELGSTVSERFAIDRPAITPPSRSASPRPCRQEEHAWIVPFGRDVSGIRGVAAPFAGIRGCRSHTSG